MCVHWIYLPFWLLSVSKRVQTLPKLLLILLDVYLLISRWVTHNYFCQKSSSRFCPETSEKRHVQELGHLQTRCMTKYWPIWGQRWSILSLCLSGWCLSAYLSSMSLTYTNLLELADVWAEASNRNGVVLWKHPSASSLFLLLSLCFFLLVFSFNFGRTISHCGTLAPPPPRCSGSLVLASLLPVYMRPSHLSPFFFHFVQFQRSLWIIL